MEEQKKKEQGESIRQGTDSSRVVAARWRCKGKRPRHGGLLWLIQGRWELFPLRDVAGVAMLVAGWVRDLLKWSLGIARELFYAEC